MVWLPLILLLLIGLIMYIVGYKKIKDVEHDYDEKVIEEYLTEIKNNPQNLSEQNKKIQKELIKGCMLFGIGTIFVSMLFMGLGVGAYYLLGNVAVIIPIILLIAWIVMRNKNQEIKKSVFIRMDKIYLMFIVLFFVGTLFVSIVSCSDGSGNDNDYNYEDSPQYHEDMYEYYQDKDNYNKDFGEKYGFRYE